MSTLGIIVEYNPFHNGHLHHVEQAKATTGAETAIAVMSGSFLQRGEPAMIDKWTRTKMALEQGVDLVIEIPTVYATQAADWFAFGSVSLLDYLNVDHLVFGSELGSIETLQKIADLLHNEPLIFKQFLKEELSLGHSYPKALSLSLQKYFNDQEFAISTPNDILGIQYLQNLKKVNSNIKAHTIKRQNAGYHDINLNSSSIASATAIRKIIFENHSLDKITRVVPETTYDLLKSSYEANRLNNWDSFIDTLLIMAKSKNKNQLAEIHGMSEGFEQRLIKNIGYYNNFGELIEALKTKRYTTTKIQRNLLYLLLNITKDKIAELNVSKGPSYIRVLGFNAKGRTYLNKVKHDLAVPLVTKVGKNKNPMLDIDITASTIYELGFKNPSYRIDEYKKSPIYLK